MTTLNRISGETTFKLDSISPFFSKSDLDYLTSSYCDSERRRHRMCFHQDTDKLLHDIIICYDNNTYVPPNKHVGKVESILILQGTIAFFVFSDDGLLIEEHILSATDKSMPFYLRVPPNTWHGLLVISEEPCIMKETVQGPYDKSTLLWADFAPSEADGNGNLWYKENCLNKLSKSSLEAWKPNYRKESDNVFYSTSMIKTFGLQESALLVSAAQSSPLKRSRLCMHDNSNDSIQEMFIVLSHGCTIPESIHVGKDESLVVIEGSGEYNFPDSNSSIIRNLKLSPFENLDHSNASFARINRYVSHQVVVTSPYMLIYESTTGPFRSQDTMYKGRDY